MKKVLLEVIATNFKDAILIDKSKADRIELISDYSKGGLSPKIQLVKDLSLKIKKPFRVMVRFSYSSFVYDDEMFLECLDFIKQVAKTKAEGIIFGSLNSANRINFKQLELVIKTKKQLKLTFHRAFDEIKENLIFEEFNKLKQYKVDSLLTSGTSSISAIKGSKNIKMLNNLANKKIEIIAGKGINKNNVLDLVKFTNIKAVHFGSAIRENDEISIKKINEIKELLNNA